MVKDKKLVAVLDRNTGMRVWVHENQFSPDTLMMDRDIFVLPVKKKEQSYKVHTSDLVLLMGE